MAGPSARRPIPALVFLLALSLLSGLVWWRVLHRGSESSASTTPTPSHSTCVTTPARVVALPKPTTVTLKVLNSTNTSGLAKTVSSELHARGFKIADYGNDPVPGAGVAEIRYGPKALAAARLTSIYLPGSVLVADKDTTTAVTVSLGAKYKTLATAAQVAAGLKKPTPTTTC